MELYGQGETEVLGVQYVAVSGVVHHEYYTDCHETEMGSL